MALAPKTVYTYPLDGSNRTFNINFEYLTRKFVQITLIGQDRKLLVLNQDYRFVTRTAIQTTIAWGPAQEYDSIEIRRFTSATDRLVDFADGSILRAYDLNISGIQGLHIAEEARDLTADTIAVNNDGDLDARGRKIVNLADAVLDGDAVTLRQEKAWGESALNQANRSQAQANLSEASAGRSASSASQANASAVASYQDAERSITARQQSENAQINSQNARDISVSSAEESNAWANTPENTTVRAGLYSSYHYSRKAATSALGSLTSANRSMNEADRSTTEADRAKSEADKLGNANAFMGTLDKVEGGIPLWKGGGLFTSFLSIKRTGSQAGGYGDVVRLIHGDEGWFAIRDEWRGVTRILTETNGDMTVAGATFSTAFRATSGSIFTSAPGNGNCHYWFEGPEGSRGAIYAGPDQVIQFRGGASNTALTVNPNGDIGVGRNVALGDSYIDSTGNITSSIFAGGSLSAHIAKLSSVTPRRMVSVQVFTGSTASGSVITLSDDAFNYEFFWANYSTSPADKVMISGLRELANMEVNTTAYIPVAPNNYITMRFTDTDPSQRRRLHLVLFAAGAGFTNLYGMRYAAVT